MYETLASSFLPAACVTAFLAGRPAISISQLRLRLRLRLSLSLTLVRSLLVLLLIGNLKRLVMLRCQEAASQQAGEQPGSRQSGNPAGPRNWCIAIQVAAMHGCLSWGQVCVCFKLYASGSNNGNKQAFFIHRNFAWALRPAPRYVYAVLNAQANDFRSFRYH